MRPIVLLLMLTLSGLPAVAGAAFEGPTPPDTCGGCPGESPEPDDERCSPVCHDCVCSLGARTTQPPIVLLTAPELLPVVGPGQRWGARADPPREPALDGVFHPPRQ